MRCCPRDLEEANHEAARVRHDSRRRGCRIANCRAFTRAGPTEGGGRRRIANARTRSAAALEFGRNKTGGWHPWPRRRYALYWHAPAESVREPHHNLER